MLNKILVWLGVKSEPVEIEEVAWTCHDGVHVHESSATPCDCGEHGPWPAEMQVPKPKRAPRKKAAAKKATAKRKTTRKATPRKATAKKKA